MDPITNMLDNVIASQFAYVGGESSVDLSHHSIQRTEPPWQIMGGKEHHERMWTCRIPVGRDGGTR